jgi:hypothetical protein
VGRKSWTPNLMMVVSILAVCAFVPAGFILSGSFADWLRSVGIHASPNLADGYQLADFAIGGPVISRPPAGSTEADIRKALSLNRFSVKKVAFRPWSGMGIAPRMNLCFEFSGSLPDPHNSARKFSMTVIHVYIRAPSKVAEPVASDKIAAVDLTGVEWNYQVIVDGFHEQARIFDTRGILVGQGLGIYVEQSDAEGGENQGQSSGTKITAALPLELLGDPARGEWRFYVLVGLADSRHPSMMLHSGQDGALELFGGALSGEGHTTPGGKPRLAPLIVAKGK